MIIAVRSPVQVLSEEYAIDYHLLGGNPDTNDFTLDCHPFTDVQTWCVPFWINRFFFCLFALNNTDFFVLLGFLQR